MTRFVREILKEKEAEFDAEREQGSHQSLTFSLIKLIVDQDHKTIEQQQNVHSCLFFTPCPR